MTVTITVDTDAEAGPEDGPTHFVREARAKIGENVMGHTFLEFRGEGGLTYVDMPTEDLVLLARRIVQWANKRLKVFGFYRREDNTPVITVAPNLLEAQANLALGS